MKIKTKKIGVLIITTLLFTVILPGYISAEQDEYRNINDRYSLNYSLEFYEKDFQMDKYQDWDVIKHEDIGQLNEIGKPMLPIKNILIAIPNNIKVTDIEILNLTEKDIIGNFNMLPVQQPIKLNEKSSNKLTTQYDQKFYESAIRYPSKDIELVGQTDIAGQNIVIIAIYPFHFIPKENNLKLISKVEFKVGGTIGNICKDYLPNKLSTTSKKIYEKTIKEMVDNPEDVNLQRNNYYETFGLEPDNYDYVIITDSSWVDAFEPLVNWKTQKGIPAKTVTTDWIYDNYNGSNKEKIRLFIQDAHNDWGTIYFLLGGDSDYIPYHTAYYLGDNIPTDTYYSDYDDDWTCEVHIGRASVNQVGTGSGGIGNFVNKSLNYEKNPPLSNFAKNVSLFGFDLDAVTDGEDCKIDIDDLYIPSNWTVTKVYDSHSGNHEDNVDIAVNDGQNLINHIDHCSEDFMGTGYTNHYWGLSNSEVDAFSNGDKQSTWYSIGCWACAFDFNNCIAEHFVRDTNGGGVAYVGNTRYGWYTIGNDDLSSLRYDRYFFKSFFNENHYRLGDLFSDHKMDAYNSMMSNDYNKYIFTELTLLGDPELPLWKENPKNFNVTFPESLTINNSSFTVHVESTEGSNINNAYVCIWKQNEVYLTGYTDSYGNLTLTPAPLTVGMMDITVTKQNFIPFEGESEVILDNYPPYEPSNPSPEDGSNGVDINADISWTGGDPDGDPVTYDVYFGNNNPPLIISANQSGTSYDLDTLDYNTTYFWKIIAWDNSSESNESPLWTFTTEKIVNNPPYQPAEPNPENGSIDVNIELELSWSGGDPDGDTVFYDVYFDSTYPPSKIVSNQTNTTYPLDILDFNTTYYWQIISWDIEGVFTNGPIWCFTTTDNSPPDKPDISGPSSGSVGISYEYTFKTNDPNADNIFYFIKWGDGQTEEWIGPYSSGEEVKISHTWDEIGTFTISAKAKDIHEANSQWGYLDVIMPKIKIFALGLNIIKWFLEKYPNIFPIFRNLIN